MSSPESERIQVLAERDVRKGKYVLYWMQTSVRAESNPALEHAIREANRLEKPLLVCFGLTGDYPDASSRHYRFLIEGLAAAASGLERRNIKLVVRKGHPPKVARDLAKDACSVVLDRGYLRHLRNWRKSFVERVKTPVAEVEGNVVVPVETVSDKREYAARTIRPKLHDTLGRFLVPLATTAVHHSSLDVSIDGLSLDDVDAVLAGLDLDDDVAPVPYLFRGGTFQARARLKRFISDSLDQYDENRGRPETNDVSYMSMYLHYGHISPVFVALEIQGSGASNTAIESYIEELIVRRELAFNYVHFEPKYDSYSAIPNWAKTTLAEHEDDKREHVYTRRELEQGKTHDRYWNAAMAEMRETGYMHNYMRMYWGKKILEWTNTPQYAFQTALYLNNKYFLDGRGPSSYANVGWVFGLHDRAFQEREVYGKVRYLSASGLERKAEPDAYVSKIEDRIGHAID